jgi:ribosome biogenesis GTPase A
VKAKRDLYDKNNDRDYYNTDNSNEFSDSDDDSDDGIDNYSDSELEFERQPNKLDLSDSVILSTEEATETLPVDKDGISPQRSGERSSFITIGFIGQPNAGKSSLINALAGRKVVSVSSTPGHTKHLQTIFLNTHTRVCDCPGLVFPSVWAPYPLQVLSGQINIAQVRETYSTLAYVGARYPLERSYGLDLSYTIPGRKGSDEEPKRSGWSGFSLAEAHAIKKSYYTSKQRPDTHRAGNEMLRDLQTGRIVFTLSPPDNI